MHKIWQNTKIVFKCLLQVVYGSHNIPQCSSFCPSFDHSTRVVVSQAIQQGMVVEEEDMLLLDVRQEERRIASLFSNLLPPHTENMEGRRSRQEGPLVTLFVAFLTLFVTLFLLGISLPTYVTN